MKSFERKKIVIIGAGPTGLGAAFRLSEIGHKDFEVFEKNAYPGGLCASFRDEQGFTWDLGGHVIFSDEAYFNAMLDRALGSTMISHARKAWIRLEDTWVPYPFQRNLRYLPPAIYAECSRKPDGALVGEAENFEDWIHATMGEGIAKYFMLPYNSKVWAYPLQRMGISWLPDRVSPVRSDQGFVAGTTTTGPDEWGANARFRFPRFGGTQAIFTSLAALCAVPVTYNTEVLRVDVRAKTAELTDGRKIRYDILINTAPLDTFMQKMAGIKGPMLEASHKLIHNGVYVVGLGFDGRVPCDKSWVYFPEPDCPFFRITYFSNYSPNNVPVGGEFFSLICETAYSPFKKENAETIAQRTKEALVRKGVIQRKDLDRIVSTFFFDVEHGYPIPTIDRDQALAQIQTGLEALGIYSRGRFGAWKYEKGNTDHSLMQGKAAAELALGAVTQNVRRC